MIDELEKTGDSSLADKEIASLMKTLATNKYQGNSAFPRKVVQPFKALSLAEIASKADERNISKSIKTDENSKESSEESSSKDEEIAADVEKPLGDNIQSAEQMDSPIDDHSSQAAPLVLPEDPNLEISVEGDDASNSSSSEEKGFSDQTNSHTTGVHIKEQLYTEAEKQESYQKGLADANKKFESEQASLQNKALVTLNSLVKRLEKKIKIDTNLLEKQLKEEILKIATERVGIAIKEVPKNFVQKIEQLVQSIKSKGDIRILKLNPDDFREVGSFLKNSEDLKNFTICPDSTLAHSDIIIELGGVSLIDSISERYNSNGKEETRHFELEPSKEDTSTNQESQIFESSIEANLNPSPENLAKEMEKQEPQKVAQKKPIIKEDPMVSSDPNLESSVPRTEPVPDQKEKSEKKNSIGEEETNVTSLNSNDEEQENEQ